MTAIHLPYLVSYDIYFMNTLEKYDREHRSSEKVPHTYIFVFL